MKRFLKVAICSVVLGGILNGCFGSFSATRFLYNVNEGVSSNVFLQTLVMWCFTILPAYELFMFADWLVINMIEFVHKRYAALNPTSSLALEVLNAYEKLAPQVQDKGPMIQSISEIRTNYRYATPVRTRATELLKSLQGSSNKKKNNTNEAK